MTGPTIIDQIFIPAAPQYGAGAFDLIALADLTQELNLSGSPATDPWLPKLITRMSSAANRFCNQSLILQTYRQLFWPYRDPQPWQSPTHDQPLQLDRWPLAATPSPAGIAPPLAPLMSAGSGGSLAAARYFGRISYVTPSGETAAGDEANLSVAANSLPSLASPGPDPQGLATGWNVYLATASGSETLQNSSPIGLNSNWTLPSSGLVEGAAVPNYVLVVENWQLPTPIDPAQKPNPLCEGVDFIADKKTAQLTRLFSDGYPRAWPMLPILAIYPAGFTSTTIDAEIQDAVIQMCKARWFARLRDPLLRAQNIEGVVDNTYWFGAGPGGDTDMTPEIEAKLSRWRVPVTA